MSIRMNISVSADLKKRMGKVSDVNWSKVACQAFQAKLGELAASKEDANMKDVVERLRASNQEDMNAQEKAGFAAGAKWAREKATAKQLKRLDDPELRRNNWYIGTQPNESPFETFYNTIEPKWADLGQKEDCKWFWENVLGNEAGDLIQDALFVIAFAEGAMSVWDEVERKL